MSDNKPEEKETIETIEAIVENEVLQGDQYESIHHDHGGKRIHHDHGGRKL